MEYLVMNSTTKIVENVAEWDGVTEWSPSTGYVALPRSNYPEAPHIGWKRVAGVFQPPAPSAQAVPASVPKRKIMKRLNRTGNLDTVQAAIDAQTGADGRDIQIDWKVADDIERVGAIAALIQSVLGLTNKQVDNIFIAAAENGG